MHRVQVSRMLKYDTGKQGLIYRRRASVRQLLRELLRAVRSVVRPYIFVRFLGAAELQIVVAPFDA
jgi:hypothetical protein